MQIRIIIFRNDVTIKSRKKDVDQDKDGEDVPKLEYVEVDLVHCNLVNNSFQKVSKVLVSFAANKQFGHLITISPHLLCLKLLSQNFKLLNYGLLNSRPLKIEDSVNIILMIGWTL